jgi:hypothetical protein
MNVAPPERMESALVTASIGSLGASTTLTLLPSEPAR